MQELHLVLLGEERENTLTLEYQSAMLRAPCPRASTSRSIREGDTQTLNISESFLLLLLPSRQQCWNTKGLGIV